MPEKKEQMKIKGKRAVIMIPATSWVKGLGHRPAFVLEGNAHMTPQGGEGKEPWYWGDPNNCAKSAKLAQEAADEYNAKNGYTKEEAAEIVAESIAMSMRSR